MIKLALSFLLGVLIFQTSRDLPTLYYIALIPGILIFCRKHPSCLPLLMLILGYAWAHLFAYMSLHPGLSSDLEGEDIQIKGTIESIDRQEHSYSRLILQVAPESIDRWQDRLPKRLQLSWYQPDQVFEKHQHCALTVRLKKFRGFANPGASDYERRMFMRNIGARGYVRRGECVPLSDPVTPIASLRHQWLTDFIQRSQRYEYAHLMQALTFGERENMQQSDWEVLRKTGTAHLLAISGLHLSAVAMVVFICMQRLFQCSARLCNVVPAQHVAAFFAIAMTAFYAYLAGFSLPTQRALIMVTLSLSAIFIYRPPFKLTILACALWLVLIINPLAVLTAGFWMSFAAVLFIFIALKASQSFTKTGRILFIQLYLGIALFPVSLLFFAEASLIAPIVNLIAIPMVSFILLPILLIAQCAFLLGVPGIEWCFKVIDYLFQWLWWGLENAAQFQFAAWQFVPTLAGVMCFELGLLVLLFARGLPLRHLSWPLLAALFLLKPPSLKNTQMRMTVLDVGQGLAVLVETNGYTLLYDAGMRSVSGFNTGQRVVQPYLEWHGIAQVDMAIVSHNDNDHAGGMHWLLANNTIDQLTVSNAPHLYSHPQPQLCRAGDQWFVNNIEFRVLHPPENWQSNDNNRSCVLQIVHPAGTILLTGDIEAQAEQWLVEQYGGKLASDIMTAPHHGSTSSSSYRFVDRVHPQTVVFSAGYRNRYGFPHAKISERYRSINAYPVDTIRQGAITFLFDPQKGLQQQAGYRVKNKRYWHSASDSQQIE